MTKANISASPSEFILNSIPCASYYILHVGMWLHCCGCRILTAILRRKGHAAALSRFAKIRKIAGSVPDEVFFFLPNPSIRTMALGSTQPLTEMSTRNLHKGKARLARKTNNLTAICESVV
jgi:hypothetical protein